MKIYEILIMMVTLVLIVFLCFFKIIKLNNEIQKNKTIYCTMLDNSNDSKMEISFDFKDGKVYRYSVISTNRINDNVNKENYDYLMSKSNKEHKGATQKFWSNEEIYI